MGHQARPACYHFATTLTRSSPIQRDLYRREAMLSPCPSYSWASLGLAPEGLLTTRSAVRVRPGEPYRHPSKSQEVHKPA
jgi:hypothetical protein